ncbi:hypothetical protein GCM10010191_87030 [Actinomadura vinacea]|uniref:Uncharacterized protein n=1 Tax=Actinomadura vinacea TaxID=115336 RepID=A0ABP5XIS5_9ACTN
MRSRLLPSALVLLLALSACQEKESPKAAPSSAPATTAPAASPSATGESAGTPKPSAPQPKLVGPRTGCGEVKAANGELVAVAVSSGRTTCATVQSVFRTYYRPGTPKQGSAGVASVRGWRCTSNTAAAASTTGRFSTCRKGPIAIVADVIP